MRGTHTLTFDFEFSYSEGGQFRKEFAVTLRAPGLDQVAVHNKMVAYAGDVGAGLAIKYSQIDRKALAKSDDAPPPEKVAEPPDDEIARGLVDSYASGLGPDRYPDFWTFVKKVLTNNAKLAVVGDTKVPLTDEVWNSIAEEGGLEAVDLIIGTFLRFFDKSPRSSAKNGNAKPTSAPSDRAVH